MYLIYSKNNCPWCEKAKNLLNNLGYEYHEKLLNVDYSKEDLVALLNKTKITVPQIFQNDQYIGGFEDLLVHLRIE